MSDQDWADYRRAVRRGRRIKRASDLLWVLVIAALLIWLVMSR